MRPSVTSCPTVLLTVSAREYQADVWTPALIMWRQVNMTRIEREIIILIIQGGLPVVLVLTVWQLATKLSVLVPRHIQETLLSPVVHLPRLTSAIPTPVAPMPSVSQEWTILQGRTGLCASVRMATEVSITYK